MKVHVLSVAPVSKVTVTLPVDVTASEKVTSMSITSPMVYEPFVLFEPTLLIVGRVASMVKEVMDKVLLTLFDESVTVIVQSEYVPEESVLNVIVFDPDEAEVLPLEQDPP